MIGDDGIRTHDLCIANAALSQLSYVPFVLTMSIISKSRGNWKASSAECGGLDGMEKPCGLWWNGRQFLDTPKVADHNFLSRRPLASALFGVTIFSMIFHSSTPTSVSMATVIADPLEFLLSKSAMRSVSTFFCLARHGDLISRTFLFERSLSWKSLINRIGKRLSPQTIEGARAGVDGSFVDRWHSRLIFWTNRHSLCSSAFGDKRHGWRLVTTTCG